MSIIFQKPARHMSIALALALATLCGSASAHRPWLLPSSTFVDDKDAWVTFDAAVSEGLFDIDHVPLKLDGLAIVGPDGLARQPENLSTGKLRNVFDLKLAKSGTYKISLVTQTAMASYTLGGESKRWRGNEEALAKEVPAAAQNLVVSRSHGRIETFVTAHKADFSVFKPSNAGLEMVPLTHPNEARVGEKIAMRFLIDGKPAANLPVSLLPGGVRYRGSANETRLLTDARGELSLNLAEAGMYWLNASYPANGPANGPAPAGERPMGERPATERPAPPALRLTYIAIFEVLPQ